MNTEEQTMINPKCAITGCALVVEDQFVWGDLFTLGDVWIFNGTYDSDGPAWHSADYLSPEHNALAVLKEASYFERRSVFVVSKANARLNQAALEFIAEWPPC